MQQRYRNLYLTHAQLDSHKRRVRGARDLLRRTLADRDRPYVGWSGGKDSLCLLGLLAEIGRTDVPVFTQGDDLDWPEKHELCHKVIRELGFEDYTWAESETSARDQLRDMDLSEDTEIRGTFSHVWREYVARRDRDCAILGLRAEESGARSRVRATRGKLYRHSDGIWRCLPLADWSGIDVFAYILARSLPYMPIYDCDDEGAPHEIRMSWMLAPQFLHRGAAAFLQRHYPRRFEQLCRLNPDLRRYL